MIRKRFLPLRGLKIVAWTVAAVAWVTAAIAGRAVAATATDTATPTGPTTTQTVDTTQQAAAPALPQNGLIVIRTGSTQTTQTQQQQQVVRKVVVQAPVRQAPAPVRQRSAGS
ncbi:MAG: hypothetical protein WAM81_05210 [Acidimicrobiia bacterium]